MPKHSSHRGDFLVEIQSVKLYKYFNEQLKSVSSLEHGTIQIRTNFIQKLSFILYWRLERALERERQLSPLFHMNNKYYIMARR